MLIRSMVLFLIAAIGAGCSSEKNSSGDNFWNLPEQQSEMKVFQELEEKKALFLLGALNDGLKRYIGNLDRDLQAGSYQAEIGNDEYASQKIVQALKEVGSEYCVRRVKTEFTPENVTAKTIFFEDKLVKYENPETFKPCPFKLTLNIKKTSTEAKTFKGREFFEDVKENFSVDFEVGKNIEEYLTPAALSTVSGSEEFFFKSFRFRGSYSKNSMDESPDETRGEQVRSSYTGQGEYELTTITYLPSAERDYFSKGTFTSDIRSSRNQVTRSFDTDDSAIQKSKKVFKVDVEDAPQESIFYSKSYDSKPKEKPVSKRLLNGKPM